MNEEKFNNIVSLAVIFMVAVIILMAIFLDIGTFVMVLVNVAGLIFGIVCLVCGYLAFNDCVADEAITFVLWGLAIIIAVIFIDKLVMMW